LEDKKIEKNRHFKISCEDFDDRSNSDNITPTNCLRTDLYEVKWKPFVRSANETEKLKMVNAINII